MALISCPECKKHVSSIAPTCPNCGYPIASRPKSIKVRCLSDDRAVRMTIFTINGVEVARGAIGTTVTIPLEKPTTIRAAQLFGFIKGAESSFDAVPGTCYETKYCKPGILQWDTVVSEVSFIG